MSNNDKRGVVCLSNEDAVALAQKLNVIPRFLNGVKFSAKVRRGEIERRRISLVKAENPAPNQLDTQELYHLMRYKRFLSEFVSLGWALRSKVSGDYYVFCEHWKS